MSNRIHISSRLEVRFRLDNGHQLGLFVCWFTLNFIVDFEFNLDKYFAGKLTSRIDDVRVLGRKASGLDRLVALNILVSRMVDEKDLSKQAFVLSNRIQNSECLLAIRFQ